MRDLRTTVGRFRGVVAPMLAKSSLFRPVARHYRKSKPGLAVVTSIARRKAGDVAFTFSPTINLTWLSGNTDRTDFHSDFTRIFQTLSVRRDGSFSFAERTHVRELLSSLFSTFGQSLREIRRSFSSSHQSSLFQTTHRSTVSATSQSKALLMSAVRNQLTRVSELKLLTDRRATSNRTNHEQRQSNWLLLRSNDAKSTDQPSTDAPHAGTNSFTTLTLNFAAPNASETELVQQRIAHFVSLPALTYAKRQKETSDEIVKALRELRTIEHEPKHVAAPVLPTIEQLTNQVKTQLERELRIERERRGL